MLCICILKVVYKFHLARICVGIKGYHDVSRAFQHDINMA